MKYVFLLLLLGWTPYLKGQSNITPDSVRPKMQWFSDAKLGIFIHWGIYAVKGVGESWSFHNKTISYPDYMQQLQGFTASAYDPDAWAALIKESGARYAVMTAKHHDGVALWNTRQNHYSVVKNTPAKRDLLLPFYKALDKYGIKRGIYFSLLDWSHRDYPAFTKDSNRYDIAADPKRWERFLQFDRAQMEELSHTFKPDLWWFDGDWEHSAAEWKAPAIRKMLLKDNPTTIINGRLQGYGDYETPEQNFPVTRPAFDWWELCMTINNNWGYQPQDTNWKTPYEIITIFADVISNGGNLLLDMGPKPDGSIPPPVVTLLQELGQWDKKYEKAIFNTVGGLPPGHFYGPTTLSKDSMSLYLFIPAKTHGEIMIKGLKNKIKSIREVGSNTSCDYKIVGKISWSPIPGLVYIQVPETVQDKYMTVLEVKLDSPLRLYRGKGGLK
ncbi:alpha-L-fucosidase [Chitinophaga costaii]|uniref:alpha-L-fucosidase n=1 Tax=Chitinophaga costaii TaxID=1335309 RepID=A0A1C3ZMT3_9BACT|nr:alpha-L-fucosidase [Chitinophaga costaii]PUZ30438.1 alpha-L-fucosidase [Chitinophaga costaii]SCB83638.1 alpha-L-fucosidase [Chitinophaga costaii]